MGITCNNHLKGYKNVSEFYILTCENYELVVESKDTYSLDWYSITTFNHSLQPVLLPSVVINTRQCFWTVSSQKRKE